MYYECRVTDKYGNLVKVITPQQQIDRATKKFRATLCDHQIKMILNLEVSEMDEYNCQLVKN